MIGNGAKYEVWRTVKYKVRGNEAEVSTDTN